MTKKKQNKSRSNRTIKQIINSEGYMVERLFLDFTKIVYRALKRQNMTVDDLAKKLKLNNRYFKEMINGKRSTNLCLKTMVRILNALGMRLEIKAKADK